SRRFRRASAARRAERGPSPGSLASRPIRRSISGPAELAKAILPFPSPSWGGDDRKAVRGGGVWAKRQALSLILTSPPCSPLASRPSPLREGKRSELRHAGDAHGGQRAGGFAHHVGLGLIDLALGVGVGGDDQVGHHLA